MALRINFNYESAATHTALKVNERLMNQSLLRLSTGLRILSAQDDAAGLFIADQLSVVASGLYQGNQNIQTGISALRIAENNAGQIFTKLQEIYVRAERAANDINDPNARQSLQQEINNFIDAIQKIGTDTEYNGIKLLDGTFQGKYIHYGARRGQVVTVTIGDLRAQSLGAYLVSGSDTVDERAYSSATTYSAMISATSNAALQFASGESVSIGTESLTASSDMVTDAKYFADWINNNTNLQEAGVSAQATNRSVASDWSDITVQTNDQVVIKFYVGTSTANVAASYTANAGETITLSELVSAINGQAQANGYNLTATAENGRLVLQTNGETIGIEVQINHSGTTGGGTVVDLGQFVQGLTTSLTSGTAAGATGAGILVGDLTIAGLENFTYDFSAVSGTAAPYGLALKSTTGFVPTGSAGFKNLYQIDVTTNSGAEDALLIADKALKQVDKARSQIGAIMNNLQSIYDAQKVAYDNTKEAENVIRNVDYAEEMSRFTTFQIRMQSGIAMLAQANQLPQLVLQLLR
ncbi:flagellin [Thermosulfurimonas sp. F29]|uniref:flagellin N-terminal helical domain-containing protein n=1 Tax=Thermosulfurimonas sp. F29 TaxID=2867247 RepID=UPI001C831964|nr:flagellin [Thermosulfurimonas sp. F29]MBX6422744.1 flagellin [Thermosulfurimonas sp. F29]